LGVPLHNQSLSTIIIELIWKITSRGLFHLEPQLAVTRPSLLILNLPRAYKPLLDEDTKSFLFEVVVVRKDFRD
jgi:hypothetical protein